MLRRSKKIVNRLTDDTSDSSAAVRYGESGPVRMTKSNASLESTVFGGESRITEHLENIDVVTSGFKVSLVIGHLCVLWRCCLGRKH